MHFETPTRTLDAATLLAALRAVHQGDFGTRLPSGLAGVSGEIAQALNAVLEKHEDMVVEFERTTRKNNENDWLKTNLARFTLMLQGHRNLTAFATLILSELAGVVDAHHGVFYVMHEDEGDGPELEVLSSYAYSRQSGVPVRFALGEGLPGQCALAKSRILLTNVPGDYVRITSGLGYSPPANILLLPVLFEGEVKAVIEIASLSPLSELHLTFLEQLTEGIGIVLNALSTMVRTEELLLQSQTQTQELQAQQEELERQNREAVVARDALEDKAAQLALALAHAARANQFKSWFLANVSHELRTPLGGILGFAELLHEGVSGPLTDMQHEHSGLVLRSAEHLAALVDDLLDLSKIEAGRMEIAPRWTTLDTLARTVVSALATVAREAGIVVELEIPADFPELHVDPLRMRQILFNLVSNAIKFSDRGSTATIRGALEPSGVAISVEDRGVGIPLDQVGRLFADFEQVHPPDGGRHPLGTGLGLSVTRQLVELHGGTIDVDSAPGRGSVFTAHLPARRARARDSVA